MVGQCPAVSCCRCSWYVEEEQVVLNRSKKVVEEAEEEVELNKLLKVVESELNRSVFRRC